MRKCQSHVGHPLLYTSQRSAGVGRAPAKLRRCLAQGSAAASSSDATADRSAWTAVGRSAERGPLGRALWAATAPPRLVVSALVHYFSYMRMLWQPEVASPCPLAAYHHYLQPSLTLNLTLALALAVALNLNLTPAQPVLPRTARTANLVRTVAQMEAVLPGLEVSSHPLNQTHHIRGKI